MTLTRGELLYEGKAKRVYLTGDPTKLIVEFKDDATAFDGKKRGTIQGKGECNNRISEVFFGLLGKAGIPTHFIRTLSPTETLAERVTIIPVEVVVRNIAAGSLAKRLGLPEGTGLSRVVLEFYYKRDDLGDPMINEYHIAALNLAASEQMDEVKRLSLRTNEVLRPFLEERDLLLVDFKLEFGLDHGGRLLLADEISPDTCRYWDRSSMEKLDKDRFRRDLGGVEDAYREVLRRVTLQ